MNLKKLFSTSLVFMLFLFVGLTNAQTTFYVNNLTGNDGWNGLSATHTGGLNGPKATLQDAIDDAVLNDIIYIASNGVLNPYTEALVTVDVDVTIIATGGAIVFSNAASTLNFTDDCEFQGNFTFENLTLSTAGTQLDWTSGVLTVNTLIDVQDATAFFVDSDGTLATTTADLQYGNFAYTTGDEFPASGVNDFDTGTGLISFAGGNHSIDGILTVGTGGLDLNGSDLEITGANAHTIDESIIDGSVTFVMTGATAINGVGGDEDLPDLNADAAAAATLTVNALIDVVGDVVADNAANIDMFNTDLIGNITNNGSGFIATAQTPASSGVGNVLMSSTATSTAWIYLDLNAAGSLTTGTITQSGFGLIVFGGNITGTITTDDVLLNTVFTLNTTGAITDQGNIYFDDDGGAALTSVVINGTLTNQATFNGSSDDAGNFFLGEILFTNSTDVDVTGTTTVNVTGNAVFSGAGDIGRAGNIVFMNATGTADFADIVVSSTFSPGAFGSDRVGSFQTNAANGAEVVPSAAVWAYPAATFAGGFDAANITNSSETDGTAGFGWFEFDDVTGAITLVSVKQDASNGSDGGAIVIAAAAAPSITVNGSVTNDRTTAGSCDIILYSAAGAVVTITGNVSNVDADIYFNMLAAGTAAINGTITNSGGGTVDLSQITTGLIGLAPNLLNGVTISDGLVDMSGYDGTAADLNLGAVNLSGGTLDITGPLAGGAGLDVLTTTFTMSGGNHIINGSGAEEVIASGDVSLTDGTLDLTGILNFRSTGVNITMGGTGTNPTFLPAFPGAGPTYVIDQAFPNVTQTFDIGDSFPVWPWDLDATTPSAIPLVLQFTGGSLRIFGDLTFNTPNVTNAILVDGARLYVGDNNTAGSGGDFDNTSGYVSLNDGFVSMSGNVAQNVTCGGANIYFGGFEVDNNSGGAPAVALIGVVPGYFTEYFYLAEGDVDGTNVEFIEYDPTLNPLTDAALPGDPLTVPHIVRNKGDFDAVPTFTDPVDVTYIGLDQTTSFELPVYPGDATKLRNLSVETTNGVVAGNGVITLLTDVQVNGVLTVNESQWLYTNGNDLYMAGPTINAGGNIVGDAGQVLTLVAPTGTIINGDGSANDATLDGDGGLIPGIDVGNNSVGNMVTPTVLGIVDNYLSDGILDNGNDDATPDGNIEFLAGGGTSDLTTDFGYTAPYHFVDLILSADDDETFTISQDTEINGDATLGGGYLNLNGFMLTHNGTTFTMDASASTSASVINFVTAGTMIVTTGTPDIAADVWFNSPGNTIGLTGGDFLSISGDVYVMSNAVPTGTTLDLVGGSNLILTGSIFEVETNSDLTGTGQLTLAPPSPNQINMILATDTGILNFEVDGNALLSGTGSLFVNDFLHTSGTFEFGSADFQIDNSYTRIAGDYTGDGWFIWSSGTATNFDNGLTPVSVNKFWMENDLDFLLGNGAFTVNNEFFLDDAVLDLVNAGPTDFNIGDGTNTPLVTVDETGGGADVANNPLNFVSPLVDFEFTGTTFYQPSTNVWPAAPGFTKANEVTVSNTGDVELLDNRYIGTQLNLLDAELGWNSPVDLELASGVTIYLEDLAALFNSDYDGAGGLAAGTLNAPLVNLHYDNDAESDGTGGLTFDTGDEYSLPTVVNNFTLTSNFGVVGDVTEVDIEFPRSIDGTVSLSSILNVNANTTFTNLLTVNGGNEVNVNATATFPMGLVTGGDVNNNWWVDIQSGGLDVQAGGTFNNAGTTDILGGANVSGGYFDNGTTNVTGGLYIDGNYTGSGAPFTLTTDGVTNDGLMFFGAGDNLVLNGDLDGSGNYNFSAATAILDFNGVNDNVDDVLDFSNAVLTTPANLDINFFGGDAVDLMLPGATTFNDVNMNMVSNDVVTISGGNLTVGGQLFLTQGLIDAQTFNIIVTLPFTTLGQYNFINQPVIAIVRNVVSPAMSHVIGNLAVMTPISAVGRVDFPVGSLTAYRPAAIEFTTADPTETATLLTVGHVDGEAVGDVNLPLDGGTKWNTNPAEPNMIGGKSDFSWRMSATPSLGVLQKYNIELQAEDINDPYDHVYNLRVIGRADGEDPANAWFIQGNNIGTNNILHTPTTSVTVRADNATGWLVPQYTYNTIGIPTQEPVWTTANVVAAAMNEAAGLVLNTYMDTYTATDLDANPSAINYSYTVAPALPAGATANIDAGGVFTFTPGWNGSTSDAAPQVYNFTIIATKVSDGLDVTAPLAITVNNTNRAPAFTVTHPTYTMMDGETYAPVYDAVDDDGDALTYAFAIAPAQAGTFTPAPALQTFSFTPAWADVANSPFVVTVTVTDINGAADVTTTTITVTPSALRGDADGDGFVYGDQIDDALTVLDYVVGNTVTPLGGTVEFYQADARQDLVINAMDAAYILIFSNTGGLVWPTFKVTAPQGEVAFDQLRSQDGIISLPLKISSPSNILSVYAEIELGDAEYQGVSTRLPEGWLSSSKYADGVLKIAMTGVNAITDGVIATIDLKLKDKDASIKVQGNAKLNDEVDYQLTANVREIPTTFALSQNYPNPFNPTTTIKYAIPENASVKLVIYDMLGQEIKTLVDAQQEAGFYTLQWDGSTNYGGKVASGIYIYRIQAGKYVQTMKMNLLK